MQNPLQGSVSPSPPPRTAARPLHAAAWETRPRSRQQDFPPALVEISGISPRLHFTSQTE